MNKIHALRVFTAMLFMVAGCLAATAAAAGTGEGGYAGAESCAACHEAISKSFSSSIHGHAGTWEAGFQGCESCHGPAGEHASSGDPSMIANPARLSPAKVNEVCLGCHGKTVHLRYWKGSIHQRRDVACTACHSVHRPMTGEKLLKAGTEMDLCIACHTDIRKSLFLRSRHPMRDSSRQDFQGNMTCSDCHNAHGAVGDSLVDASSVNDKCYECHTEKKAPMIWEHKPVKENCLVCHSPHGSNNKSLLVKQVPRLCHACHFQGRHQTVAGSGDAIWSVSRGCVNCHPMIHGSNHPSAVKLNK